MLYYIFQLFSENFIYLFNLYALLNVYHQGYVVYSRQKQKKKQKRRHKYNGVLLLGKTTKSRLLTADC